MKTLIDEVDDTLCTTGDPDIWTYDNYEPFEFIEGPYDLYGDEAESAVASELAVLL